MIPAMLYLFVIASEAQPLVGSGVSHPYDAVVLSERQDRERASS
jgi:hypothetical protein